MSKECLEYHDLSKKQIILQQEYTTFISEWYRLLVEEQPIDHEIYILQRLEEIFLQIYQAATHKPIKEDVFYEAGQNLVDLGFNQPINLRHSLNTLTKMLIHSLFADGKNIDIEHINLFHSVFSEGFSQRICDKIIEDYNYESKKITAEKHRFEICLQSFLKSVPALLGIVDKQGKIVFVGGKSTQSININPDRLLGRSLFEFTNLFPDLSENLHSALRGDSFVMMFEFREKTFETRCFPYKSEDMQMIGVIVIALDVTDSIKQKEDMRKLRNEQTIQDTSKIYNLLQEIDIFIQRQFMSLQHKIDQLRHNHQFLSWHVHRDLDAFISECSTTQYTIQQFIEQARVVNTATISHPNVVHIDFSPDERTILQLLLKGKTNRQIAQAIGISEKAVEKRLTKLFLKLNVTSRTEAMAWAINHSFI